MPGPQSGGETAKDPSALTPDILNVHIQAILNERDRLYEERDRRYNDRFDAQEKAVAAALANAEKATLVAEKSDEKWREAANEWRQAMDDRERNFMPRPEADQTAEALNARLVSLEKSRDLMMGRSAGVSMAWAVIVAAIPIAFAIYAALN